APSLGIVRSPQMTGNSPPGMSHRLTQLPWYHEAAACALRVWARFLRCTVEAPGRRTCGPDRNPRIGHAGCGADRVTAVEPAGASDHVARAIEANRRAPNQPCPPGSGIGPALHAGGIAAGAGGHPLLRKP